MVQSIHLTGKNHSERVVHVRMLDLTETEENLTQTATILGTSSNWIALKKAEWRNGVKRFITAISEPTDDPEKVKVRKVTVQDLDANFSGLFTPKDQLVLESLYRDYHEITPDEVEDIVGKARAVSAA